MNITSVSKKYKVSADTLRYYERVGVIPPITRDQNGYRNFSEYDLNWVYFATAMRNAGVSVEALVEYNQLFKMGREKTAEARKSLLIEQRQKLREKVKELTETLHYLNHKIETYEEHLRSYEIKLDKKAVEESK